MTYMIAKADRGGRIRGSIRPPGLVFLLYTCAVAASIIVALPLIYLVFRAADAEGALTELILRRRTWEILRRSVTLASLVTLFSLFISLPLAWLLVRAQLPLKRMWTVLTSLPMVIPSYVGGFVAVAMLGPRGELQRLLEPLGVDRVPEIYGLGGAVVTLTLLRFPYMLLPLRASLSNLDPSLEESSRSLGKGQLETFLRVILPQLGPAIAGGCLLTALSALSDFGAVSLLRYETFTWAIYLRYQSAYDMNGAAALALVLAVLSLVPLLLAGRTLRGASAYGAGRVRRPPLEPARLGPWKIPALALCCLLVFCSIALPVSTLLIWLARGLADGESFWGLPAAALSSIHVSAAAALVTVAAAFPVAYLSVRRPGALSSAMEKVSYAGFALPGIVVALALVFFGIRFLSPLYQSIPLLAAGYVILFLPVAVGPLRSVLLQLNPRLEEAALSLGRPQSYVMTRVIIPLSRPGLLAGAALSFLAAMRELPATLLLSPIGFRTLATSIWSASSEAFFAQSAVYSLVLIAVSSVPAAILIMKERGLSGA
jgi:iron(III) transport system permease protein